MQMLTNSIIDSRTSHLLLMCLCTNSLSFYIVLNSCFARESWEPKLSSWWCAGGQWYSILLWSLKPSLSYIGLVSLQSTSLKYFLSLLQSQPEKANICPGVFLPNEHNWVARAHSNATALPQSSHVTMRSRISNMTHKCGIMPQLIALLLQGATSLIDYTLKLFGWIFHYSVGAWFMVPQLGNFASKIWQWIFKGNLVSTRTIHLNDGKRVFRTWSK